MYYAYIFRSEPLSIEAYPIVSWQPTGEGLIGHIIAEYGDKTTTEAPKIAGGEFMFYADWREDDMYGPELQKYVNNFPMTDISEWLMVNKGYKPEPKIGFHWPSWLVEG